MRIIFVFSLPPSSFKKALRPRNSSTLNTEKFEMEERILQDIAGQKRRLAIAQICENTEEKADAYYNLGIAYYSLEDFHQAIEYLKAIPEHC